MASDVKYLRERTSRVTVTILLFAYDKVYTVKMITMGPVGSINSLYHRHT